MVLHKFALLGGKVPAATGMRAAGRPPKAGKRASPVSAAAPPGLRPAGCPPKTLPLPGAAVFGLFLWEGVRFLRLMFFRRLCTFCGRDRTDSPSPARASDQVVFIHPRRLAIVGFCRWGKDSPHPRKGKPMDRFLPPFPLVNFGPLQWGRIVPIPARARQTDGFFIPYRPALPTAG